MIAQRWHEALTSRCDLTFEDVLPILTVGKTENNCVRCCVETRIHTKSKTGDGDFSFPIPAHTCVPVEALRLVLAIMRKRKLPSLLRVYCTPHALIALWLELFVVSSASS